MKTFIFGHPLNQGIIFDHLPFRRVDSVESADFVVICNHMPEIRREALKGKKIVVFDWTEGDYDVPLKEFGDLPIDLYLKRELIPSTVKPDSVKRMLPLDFVCHSIPRAPTSDYLSRPIKCLFVYGWSNRGRRSMHGEMIRNWPRLSQIFAQDFATLDSMLAKGVTGIVAIMESTHENRVTIEKMYEYYSQSMLAIDLYGSGIKCFRNHESALLCASAKQDPSAAVRAWPWRPGTDCVSIPNLEYDPTIVNAEGAVEIIVQTLNDPRQLPGIWMAGRENAMRYHPKEYVGPIVLALNQI